MKIFKFRFLLLSIILCLSAWILRNLRGVEFLGSSMTSGVLYALVALIFILAACLSISSLARLIFKRVKFDAFAWDMALTTVFVIAFTVGGMAFQPQRLPAGSFDLAFDAAVWQSKAGLKFGDDLMTPRQKMLADVVKNILPGKSRAQIIEVLGKPDGIRFAKLADMVYVMGPERDSSYKVDYEWLLIFIENGVFKGFNLFTD